MRRWFLGLSLLGILIFWRVWRRLLAFWWRIPAPQYQIKVTRNLRLLMRDGVTLATDHYFPDGAGFFPTILIRSPYGRGYRTGGFGDLLAFFAGRFTERGYHVLVQDVRGRFDSEGNFEPFFNEQSDGLDTLAWIEAQPWFDGRLGMWGPSYLGVVQWVIANQTDKVMALVPIVTGSQLHRVLFPDGTLDFNLALRWIGISFLQNQYHELPRWMMWKVVKTLIKTLAPDFDVSPQEADQILFGEEIPFYRLWLANPLQDDEPWQVATQQLEIHAVKGSVHLVGGWYDFFLRALLLDYATLRQAGQTPYLTIGPWHHFSQGGMLYPGFQKGLAWFDAQLKGNRQNLRERPVSVFVMGRDEWREMDAFPPAATSYPYYLREGGGLSKEAANEISVPSHYFFDPRNPTPSLGGAQFSLWAGSRDQRGVERRLDVLTFTSPLLTAPLEIIGYVKAVLYVQSSRAYTDFVVRLCDVLPDGRSMNICDGLFRVTPENSEPLADGVLRIEIDLWATAYCFWPGHCIRVHVASGAHPRWNRNPGTGQLFDTEMYPAQQTIYHDRTHPSCVVLPQISAD